MSQAIPVPEPGPFGHVPTPFEVVFDPDGCAAWTVAVTPGSATAGVLARLDPVGLSQAGRVDALVATQQLSAWVDALRVRLLAAVAANPVVHPSEERDAREWASEDVRVALGVSVGRTACSTPPPT